MLNYMLFVSLMLSFLLGSCGVDSDIGNFASLFGRELGPWIQAGEPSLPEDPDAVNEYIRILEFGDGMTVSYDGSDESGTEEVCRRHEQTGTVYEVCMTLEDDPYFVVSELNTEFLRPFMFEKFQTGIICKVDDVVKNCETEVFPLIGGEEFRCYAGVHNTDRALMCSDQWAVVVNGEEEDTKSVCRVYLESGSGRCLGAPKQGVSDEALIRHMQKSSWKGVHGAHANPRQALAGETLQSVVPQNLPPGAVVSYHSRSEEVCTVDNDDSDGGMGNVTVENTVTVPEHCTILLKVSAEGFVDRVFFAHVQIVHNNDTAWVDYTPNGGVLYVGESLSAGAVTSTNPASPEIEYSSVDESICVVDGSGTITALGSGKCEIRLLSTAEEHLDVVIEKSVSVLPLSLIEAIEWNTFPTDTSVGMSTQSLGEPVPRGVGGIRVQGSSLAFHYDVDGDCSFDSVTGILSFMEESECVVTVRVSGARGYEDKSKTFRIVPGKGDLGLTWTGYANLNPKLTDSPLTSVSPDVASPSDANGVDYTYAISSSSASVCEVDASTGALTLKSVGSCAVNVTASRSGYDNDIVSNTVVVDEGEQEVQVTHPVYGGALYVSNGDSLSVEHEPSGYGILAYQKKNSSDSCTVSGSSGELTAHAGSGTCTVQAMRRGNEQYEASDWVDVAVITMVPTSQVFSWESEPYGDTLTVAVGETLDLTTSSTGGTGGAEYKTADKTICTVNVDGDVTGVTVGDCTLLGRWMGDATAGASDWVQLGQTISITIGDGPTDLTGIYAYGAHPSLKVGETLEVVEMTMAYGMYMYGLKAGSETFCNVNDTTGRITGLAAGRCAITVMLGGNVNYRASTADLLVITVQKGEQRLNISGNPYGVGPSLMTGETLPLVGTLSGSQGGTIAYQVKSGSDSYCSVDASNGTITAEAPGDCTIEARAGTNSNYNASSWMEVATVVIEAGTLSGISWIPAHERGVVGEDLELDALDVSGAGISLDVTYMVKDAGRTDCTFKGNSGANARTLIFENVGVCRVVARASHAHFQAWEQEHSIQVVPGSIDFTLTNFPNGVRLKVGVGAGTFQNPAPISSSTLSPSDAQISWQLVRGERDCVMMNSEIGLVRARAVPVVNGRTKCSLMAVAKKKGYRTVKKGPVEILLEKGDLGMITSPDYGSYNELPIGGRANLVHPAREINHAELNLSYTVRGTNSSDQLKQGVCSVDADGNVIAGSSGALNDKCIVSTTVTAVGYNDLNSPIVVTLRLKGNLVFEALPAPMWDGILVVGKNTPLNQTVTSFPGSDGSNPAVNVNWRYRVTELRSNGASPTAGDVCAIASSTGRVTIGNNPSRGDICLVRIEAYADTSHITYAQIDPIPLRVHGVLGAITTPVYYREGFGRSEQLIADGGRLEVIVPPREAGHVPIEVSYAAIGKRAGSETVDICSVDTDSDSAHFGVVRAGVGATRGDTCEITATAQAHLYEDKDADVVELALVDLLEFPDGLSLIYSENLKYGSSTARGPSTLPGTSSNSISVTWEYQVALAGSASDSSILKDDVCVADMANGDLTLGGAAAVGDACLIQAVGSAVGYADFLLEAIVVVEPGDLAFASATKPIYSGDLRATGSIAPTIPHSPVDDHAIAVTWGDWRVVENDADGSDDGSNDGDVCSVDESGVVHADGFFASVGDTCTVYGIAIADNYSGREEMLASLTLVAQGSFTGLTSQAYTGDLMVDGGAVTMTTEPGASPSDGTTWTYRALGTRNGVRTNNICSVGVDGSVTLGGSAVVGDVCTVSAMAHHNGYATASPPSVSLTVKAELDSLTWTSFPSSATVGVEINLSFNQPVSSPVADDYAITATGSCHYDRDKSILSFSGTTSCTVRVVASKANYVDKEETFTVTPGAGTLSFDTAPALVYHGKLRYGDTTTELSRDALPEADDNGVSVTWGLVLRGWASSGSTTPQSNVCTFNPVNDNVRLDRGEVGHVCDIHVIGRASGYNEYTSVAHVQIEVSQGLLNLSWTPADSGVVGTDLELPDVTGTVTDDMISYIRVSGDHCNLNTQTLTFSNTGKCVVRATVERDSNYEIWNFEHTITVSAGTLAFVSIPTLAYDQALRYGDASRELSPSGLPENDANSVDLTWLYSVQGRDSGDENDLSDVCSLVSSDTAHADYGKVQLGSHAAVGNICRVSVTGQATGYTDYAEVADLDLTVGLGVQPEPTGWSNHYGSSPSIAVGETLNHSGVEPTNSIDDGGALEYNVKSGGCTLISSSSGEVRGTSSVPCVIEARFAAVADKYTESDYSEVATITVTMGSQSYTWSQSSASETFGNELILAQLMGTPDGAVVTYEIVTDTNSADCDFKGESGADARTLTFDDDGSCQVRVRVTRPSYGDWTSHPLVTITVDPASWTMEPAWDGYGNSNMATYGSPAPARENPGSTPSATWTYSTSSELSVCTVDEDNGALTVNGAGDCVVTAIPDLAGYGTHTGIEETVTISPGTQSPPSGWSNHYGVSPRVQVGGTLDFVGTEPTNSIHGGGSLVYRVKSGDCTVDSSSGQVGGTGINSLCKIEAHFAEVPNKYSASAYSDVASITVELGTQTYTAWSQSDAAVTYSSGGEVPLVEFTGAADGATVNYNILNTSTASCTWKGGSGTEARTLQFADDGVCNVQVQVTLTNYEDWTSDSVAITVNPASWVMAPQWSGYDGRVTFGGSAVLIRPSSRPSHSHWVYAENSGTRTVCGVSSGGELIYRGVGECTLTVTSSLAGYPEDIVSITFRIHPGNQSIPSVWSNPYGESPMAIIGGSVLSLDGDASKPSGHGNLQYQVASGDTTYCSVNAGNGDVTGLAPGVGQNCVIQARFSGNDNYDPSGYNNIATISIVNPQNLASPVYTEGSNLYKGHGNVVTVATQPAATNASTNAAITPTPSFSYSAQGKRGSVETSNICDVNAMTGKVTVGSAAQANDTCEITVISAPAGYASAEVTVTLTVQAAVTYTQLAGRFFTSRCISCHSTVSSGSSMATAGWLNRDPTQASLWKRVQRAHDWSNTGLGSVMPQGCTSDGVSISSCLSAKDVEYVASFLRGGSWDTD